MAENKKSFLIYSDTLYSIDHLTNEEKGILFQHLLEYVNDMNPVLEDRLVLTAWKPIERQLKRDLKKWEEQQEQRKLAGKRSAEIRRQNSTSVNDRSISSTVNGNGNVNDINTNVLNTQTIDQWILDLKNESQFLEGLYMTHKLKPNSLGKIALLFKEHLKMHPKNHEKFVDFRNHFGTWVGFKIKKGELGEYLKHQKGEL